MNPLPPGTVRAPRPPAPPLTDAERAVVAKFDAAPELPESWECYVNWLKAGRPPITPDATR